jgi:predicted transposase/invertase (TIGR01784 family)
MLERVTPRIDLVFKKIFGVEENKDLLIALINSIVSEEDQVKTITLLNPYNAQCFWKDKLSILDIKAEGHNGKRYNIEIQITDEKDYDKRALYYWAKLYTEQLQKSEGYASLNKAIGIHILNFISIPSVDNYHNIFRLKDNENNTNYFKDIELHTIELTKFERNLNLTRGNEWEQLMSKMKTSLDRWAAFLTKCDILESKKHSKELNDPQLEKALDVLDEVRLTGQEKDAYEDRLKFMMIEMGALQKAEEKGIKKVAKSLLSEGVPGEVIAKVLLAQGISHETVAEITGLSPEKFEKLKP